MIVLNFSCLVRAKGLLPGNVVVPLCTQGICSGVPGGYQNPRVCKSLIQNSEV
jgi:hypothetical protein